MSSKPPSVDASDTATPATAAAGKPALCEAAQPAQLTPFLYNKDASRRDKMVGIDRGQGDGYTGGTASFYGLDARGLASLIQERFVDPYEQQNSAPAVWQIFRFLCQHPQVSASGYVVSIDRPDYRTSIDDISAPNVDATLRADAQAFCVDADETTFEGHLECFWD